MTPDIILTLLQSFQHARKASAFPESFMPNHEFGNLPLIKMNPGAVNDLLKFLCLDGVDWKDDCSSYVFAEYLCSLWQDGFRRICFHTSGSTGEPKPCIHSLNELEQEAEFLKTFLGDRKRFICCAPPHHCYGFMFGLFLPYILNCRVKRMPPFANMFFAALNGGDAGIGFPLMYEAEKMFTNGNGVTLVSASAPFAQGVFNELLARDYKIMEIFGSSETGVLGWRSSPESPFRLLPYFSKIDVKTIFREGMDKKIELMDSLEWAGPAEFYPRGRFDQVIQVGGVNVSMARVKNMLDQIPGVEDCAVRSIRPGGRLKAFIVIKEGSGKEAVKNILAAARNFPVAERPVKINFGNSLPKNAMGKLVDWD